MKKKFNVDGMVCASCQATVNQVVKKLKGVKSVDVSLIGKNMTVDFNEKKINEEEIIEAVNKSGYEAFLYQEEPYQAMIDKRLSEQRKRRNRLMATLTLVALLMIFAMGPMIAMKFDGMFITDNPFILISIQLILLIPILILNYTYFTNGFKALISLHPNMDSLICIGSGAAIIYGLYVIIKIIVLNSIDPMGNMEQIHELGMNLYLESAGTIIGLVSLGKYLETLSIDSTLVAIGKLVTLAPDHATLIQDGKEVQAKVNDLSIGQIILIKPGDRIPLDGKIIDGYANLDESSLTGESIPVTKTKGDQVISGTLNFDGSFKMVIEKVGKDTTLNKIVELVSEASSFKTSITKLVDKVSLYFVPTVMALALLTFIIWASISPNNISLAFNFAISVLVISCPCALGLATPVATIVGAKKGAQNGILIKSSQGFESLDKADYFVFDKTGTITTGKMEVMDINIPDDDIKGLLPLESLSTHPLSKAISSYLKKKEIEKIEASNFSSIPGRGIQADINGHVYKSGNMEFIGLKEEDLTPNIKEYLSKGSLVTYVSKDDEFIGYYVLSDTIKQSSIKAIERLKQMGKKVILLTGDNEKTAFYFASLANIDEVISKAKPDDKLRHIERLQKEGYKVAMIGDGINDSPSLMKADIGIAIGAGSDIAVDSADIVLIRNDLMDVVSSIRLCRKVQSTIKTNLFWAFFYNIIAIPFAAGILYFPPIYFSLNPMIASLCMAFSSVSVVLNALRINLFKK